MKLLLIIEKEDVHAAVQALSRIPLVDRALKGFRWVRLVPLLRREHLDGLGMEVMAPESVSILRVDDEPGLDGFLIAGTQQGDCLCRFPVNCLMEGPFDHRARRVNLVRSRERGPRGPQRGILTQLGADSRWDSTHPATIRLDLTRRLLSRN
jgi:hypothetical protein